MIKFTQAEIGKAIYIDKEGEIWRLIGYQRNPTFLLKNIRTETLKHIVATAPMAQDYTKLIPEDD